MGRKTYTKFDSVQQCIEIYNVFTNLNRSVVSRIRMRLEHPDFNIVYGDIGQAPPSQKEFVKKRYWDFDIKLEIYTDTHGSSHLQPEAGMGGFGSNNSYDSRERTWMKISPKLKRIALQNFAVSQELFFRVLSSIYNHYFLDEPFDEDYHKRSLDEYIRSSARRSRF